MNSSNKFGYALGAIISAFLLFLVFLPENETWFSAGPASPGHESLVCADCHTRSDGTWRQQLQANLKYALGLRETSVAFHYKLVENEQCETCHKRERDMHPTYRFLEPRFADVRRALGPQSCISCHQDHLGVRVTMDVEACGYCHESLDLENDPIEDVSHAQLIANNDWESCVGCHDFHGNHSWVVPKNTGDQLTIKAVMDYYGKGPSPYGPSILKAGDVKND